MTKKIMPGARPRHSPDGSKIRSVRSERIYTDGEIVEMLEKAEAMGYSMEKGSELEQCTIGDLDRLVNERQ